MTQEFHISVTPIGSNKYLVRTDYVEPGVPLAEEQVDWSVEEWLAQAQHLMNDPLLGLLQGGTNRIGGFELPFDSADRPSNAPMAAVSITLVELGQKLYSALFQGTLRDSWVAAQGIAQHRGETLRLRLGLKGLHLPRLPWEVLYASEMPTERSRSQGNLAPPPRPITADRGVAFSRYQPGARLVGTGAPMLELDQPLRILMAIAAAPDQEQLQLKREVAHLQQELSSPGNVASEGMSGKFPDIQLTILDQPGREELTHALEQGQYQVLHYAGHSNLGAAGGDLYLVNHKTGLTEPLSGDDLAGLLVNNGIRMAIFNSCRGAHTAASDPATNMDDRNLAEALVGRGIPAVLAMAERIPDDVALSLTRLFYRNLKQGYPVDLSLNRARQGLITSYGSQQLYWALPILYMHRDFDGYLTTGDRSFDASTERAVVLPRDYEALANLAGEVNEGIAAQPLDVLPLESEAELELISKAVLEDDDFNLVEEFEGYNGSYSEPYIEPYSEPYREPYNNEPYIEPYGNTVQNDTDIDDDLSYEQDAAVVADLIHRLSAHQSNGDGRVTLTNDGVILPNPPDAEIQPDGEDLPDAANGLFPSSYTNGTGPSSNATISTESPAILSPNVPRVDPATPPPARPKLKNRYIFPILGAVGVGAIALVSLQVFPDLFSPYDRRPDQLLPVATASPADPDATRVTPASPTQDFLRKADTNTVTAIASRNFSQNKLPEGQQAVEALLDRGALQAATTALEAVASEQSNNPDISFLKGRLAWEWRKRGNSDFSLDDARRFWETAVKGRPDSTSYLNALGFALYAEGKSERAIKVWCKSLALLQPQQPTPPTGQTDLGENCPIPTQTVTGEDTLTATAGIALGLKQASENRSLDNPQRLMERSIALHQIIMQSDPAHFQPDELGKIWIWTNAAVEDWRALATR